MTKIHNIRSMWNSKFLAIQLLPDFIRFHICLIDFLNRIYIQNITQKLILNPAKTNGELLISSFGTSPQTAKYNFQYALSKTVSSDPNKAFHLIQSFAPGEVSYEEAHQIGIELADKLLEGKYAYVIATHIDKGHCHNHICFCAADNINHKKYHDCKKTIIISET